MKEIDIHQLIDQIKSDLRQVVLPERREMAKSYYPTKMEVLGVKVPDQRQIVKKLNQKIKGTSDADILKLAKELVNTGIFECQQVGYEILERNKRIIHQLILQDIEDLGKGLDNWVSVDTFSAWLAGVAWRIGNIPDEVIKSWTQSEDFWRRRVALVSTIALNQKARGGTGDVPKTLEICRLLAHDKEDMVAKALSWALREASKIDKEAVIGFMKEYDEILPKRVKREVGNKLATGRKY